jgi:hypothetical protein
MPQARMWNKGATTRLRVGSQDPGRAPVGTALRLTAARGATARHPWDGRSSRWCRRSPPALLSPDRLGRGRPVGQLSVQHRRGPAVADDELGLGRREPRADRDRNRARQRHAEERQAPVGAIRQPDRHPAARADPGGQQATGDAAGLIPQAGVAEPAPGPEVGDRLRLRAAADRVLHERGQVRGEPGQPRLPRRPGHPVNIGSDHISRRPGGACSYAQPGR